MSKRQCIYEEMRERVYVWEEAWDNVCMHYEMRGTLNVPSAREGSPNFSAAAYIYSK